MAHASLRAVQDVIPAGAPVPSAAPAVVKAVAKTERLVPLDWMRGIVMVLMAVDHSSEAFNAGRLFTDSMFFYRPGTPLPVAQFLTRFITHLCAPTFVFLAGTGLAFTVERQVAKGERPWIIDRQIATRGLVIAAFELWISWFVVPPNTWLLQVLYAIGVSFLFMVPLRRLSNGVAVGLALLVIAAGEAIVGISVGNDPSHLPLALALLVVGGERPPLIIGYPPIHWLAIMLLGWAWGRMLLRKAPSGAKIARQLAWAGAAALLVFALVRGANGYGNMLLLREDQSLVQWLHVSKYPPSISYTALELGIMALVMAALFRLAAARPPGREGLLLTIGHTPMFFYLLHFPLLVMASHIWGVHHQLGLAATYAGAAAIVIVLYPACRWYRPFKASGRFAFTRYV
ncbi:MAG TPA: heparan-alpha-glucosaminide N-acetyltransferase domain-containing protein [Polyangiaceae bacterium]|nr:heparan-alpha-glucosaminide N-acetyltransferase domain-containing protein [Polyangiaceae bacterium]